ncbi:MAG: endo-1,4-beta-xylanase [Armatimonadetes bacterium]|nr:endo-1,4-beta-xylanase [Armatimonadota bacterium]
MRNLALILLAAAAGLAAPADRLLNGDFTAGTDDWSLPTENAQVKVIDASGRPGKALRVVTAPPAGAPAWSIQLLQTIDGSLAKDHRLQIRFWARSERPYRITAFLQYHEAPHTKSVAQTFTVGPEWREYVAEGKALQAFRSSQAALGFFVGHDSGTVDLAGVRLLDLDDEQPEAGPRPTAAQPHGLIQNGDFAAGGAGWTVIGGERLKVEPVAVQTGGYAQGLRLTADPAPGSAAWSLALGQPNRATILRHEVIYLRAWLRSAERRRVNFVFEEASEPYRKDISQSATLAPEWKEYRFAARAQRSYRPGEGQLRFFLGMQAGSLEIAGVRMDNCGRGEPEAFDQTIDHWGGREHNDAWRAPALARIEQLRKGDLVVKVVDAAGKPVPQAAVRVTQQRHHFRFGTAAPAGRFVDATNPDNVRFQQEVARLFNTVTFENDLKWNATSPERIALVGRAIDWLHAHDLEVRGHCLVWGSYKHLPGALRELRGEALRTAIEQHVEDYASRFRGQLYLWDVVNEAGSNTEVWDEVGWEQFANSFRWAREADPHVKLAYNDYSMTVVDDNYRNKVTARVKYLIEQGAPFDTIGLQEHHGTPLTPIGTLLKYFDYWAQFGKDLEVTEYDLSLVDDAAHGEWSRDHLIAAFSHPKITAYIMWGFWQGSHWRAKEGGAMLRRDWSKRPAALAYEELVLQQWWTRWQGASDAAGAARLRAFYGTHEVAVEAGGKQATARVKLEPQGAGEVVVTLK